jgi:hypothetical protein
MIGRKEGLDMLNRGGHTVKAGTYWNMVNGSRIDLADEGPLPGGHDTLYVKAPSIAVLAAGPALGLLFAVFLPFIGIAMAATLMVRKVGDGVREAAAASVTFGWKPIEAYLSGRKRKRQARDKEQKRS